MEGSEHAPDIHRHHPVEILQRELVDRRPVQDAGVDDEDVQPAKPREGPIDGRLDLGGIPAVGLQGDRLALVLGKPGHQRLGSIGRGRKSEGDLGAVGGQARDDGRTDAARAAQHQCHLACLFLFVVHRILIPDCSVQNGIWHSGSLSQECF